MPGPKDEFKIIKHETIEDLLSEDYGEPVEEI